MSGVSDRRLALIALVAFAAIGAGVAATPAAADSTVEAAAVESNETVVAPSAVLVDRGDVTSIPVELDGTDTAYVAIGRESDAGFRAIVEVVDGDGDGSVTLEANTYTLTDHDAPVDDTFWTADDADSVGTVRYNGSSAERPIPIGTDGARSYDVRVSTGFDTTTYEHTGDRDRTVLRVSERSTGAISMWTAPMDAEIDDSGDVTNAVATDSLTESQFVAEGDYAVVELEATGIFGALEAQPGSSNVEKLASLDENVSSLNFTVERPGATPFRGDGTLDLAANADALTVIPNQADGRLFVLIDTDALGLEDGDQRVPTFTVDAGDTTETLATSETDDVTIEEAFEVDAPEVDFDHNEVSPAAGQTISGVSNLAPGTELTLVVESELTPDSESAFIEQFTATVQADGTWSGQADLSEGYDGQGYSVWVLDPDLAASYDGEIGRLTASISAAEATADRITIESVELSEGGFVVVKSGSATGSFAGVSGYLEPGLSSDVEIPVSGVSEGETVYAVAHTDANGNEQYDGDGAYTNADGSRVSDSVTLSSSRDVDYYRGLTDPTDELSPSAVMTAKGDYLTDETDLATVVAVMRAYFFS